MTGRLLPQDPPSLRSQSPQTPLPADDFHLHSDRNVFSLLVQREILPKSKYVPKRRWGEASQPDAASSSGTCSQPARDAKRCLISWVEADSLRHLAAKYCPLLPPPRSTIAAAFSSDGRILASTHGDHTVKIIDCETGNCLKVLTGHRRTPWVVRFHPFHSEILASGSLDHEVRLWNAKTSECIGSHDFYRPIASLAFHAEGEFIAVASGHKLYIWDYNKTGAESTPTIVLKTRRSLRAVHFHPHVAPFLLTAEVNDIDSSDSSMTRATSPGYLRYPSPRIFVAHAQTSDRAGLATELPLLPLPYVFMPSISVDDQRLSHHSTANSGSISTPPSFETNSNVTENHSRNVVSAVATPVVPSISRPDSENSIRNTYSAGTRARATNAAVNAMYVDEFQPRGRSGGIPFHANHRSDLLEFGHQFYYFRDRASWELPFLHGWLMAQSHANSPSMVSLSGGDHGNSVPYASSSSASYLSTVNLEAAVANLEIPGSINLFGMSGRGVSREHITQSYISVHGSREADAFGNSTHNGNDNQPMINRIQSELATSLAAAAAAAELPCTVKLRVWSHDVKDPRAILKSERCRLTIPHAVLCSEMGAHFSPCGRFLAACVACVLPHAEADPGLQTLIHQDSGFATSPTRHPVTAHQVMYELRVYSLEEATFGSVLVSRAIRAAHCLTSIQFSPTSEHILPAYGRRHGSLLKSIVIEGDTTSPIYTVLEVYRVSDMELVSVLPSAEDEVNVACFHPSPGGGLVYGTKEGKLRVFRYNNASNSNLTRPNYSPGEILAEVQTYALEC